MRWGRGRALARVPPGGAVTPTLGAVGLSGTAPPGSDPSAVCLEERPRCVLHTWPLQARNRFNVCLLDVERNRKLAVSVFFRDCNKVQEKRGAVYERITTINQETQKVRFAIQQLKDATEREKLKSQVSVVGVDLRG